MKIGDWVETQKGRVGMWVAIGPLLLMATLLTGLLRMQGIGTLSALSLILSFILTWKGKVIGSLVGVVFTGLCLGLSSYATGATNWWHTIFVCTLLLGLVITALSLTQGEEALVKNEERLQAKLEELGLQNSAAEKAHLQEKIAQEKTVEELNAQLRHAAEELAAQKRLVQASGEDAEKYYSENCTLKEQLLEMHRRDRATEEVAERADALEEETGLLRKKLNHYRVEHYQQDLLATHFGERIFAHNERLKKRQPPVEAVESLQQLQTEREEAKGKYESLVTDYKQVTQKLVQENSPNLKEELGAKRAQLATLRERIFKLEGEMLKTQQQLGSGAISPEEGYLAIADGECHRLEEENSFLLNLLQQMEKTE